MKETLFNGGIAPSPHLIDLFAMPRGRSRRHPLPPQETPGELPLLEWPFKSQSTKKEVGNPPIQDGGNDALAS